jgi:hypothetical protein
MRPYRFILICCSSFALLLGACSVAPREVVMQPKEPDLREIYMHEVRMAANSYHLGEAAIVDMIRVYKAKQSGRVSEEQAKQMIAEIIERNAKNKAHSSYIRHIRPRPVLIGVSLVMWQYGACRYS